MADTIEVAADSDWEYEFDVTRKNTASGEVEAAAGLTATAHFSLTEGGADIDSTSTSLTERTGTPGRYAGIIDESDLGDDLDALVGEEIYEVFSVSGDRLYSRKVLVVASEVAA